MQQPTQEHPDQKQINEEVSCFTPCLISSYVLYVFFSQHNTSLFPLYFLVQWVWLIQGSVSTQGGSVWRRMFSTSDRLVQVHRVVILLHAQVYGTSSLVQRRAVINMQFKHIITMIIITMIVRTCPHRSSIWSAMHSRSMTSFFPFSTGMDLVVLIAITIISRDLLSKNSQVGILNPIWNQTESPKHREGPTQIVCRELQIWLHGKAACKVRHRSS